MPELDPYAIAAAALTRFGRSADPDPAEVCEVDSTVRRVLGDQWALRLAVTYRSAPLASVLAESAVEAVGEAERQGLLLRDSSTDSYAADSGMWYVALRLVFVPQHEDSPLQVRLVVEAFMDTPSGARTPAEVADRLAVHFDGELAAVGAGPALW